MAKSKVTLIGPLTLAIGRYRFSKGHTVLVEDEELLRVIRYNPDFRVEEVQVAQSSPPIQKPSVQKETPKKAVKQESPKAKSAPPPKASPGEDIPAPQGSPEMAAPEQPQAPKRLRPKKQAETTQ